jgi:hypothetical protein
MLRANRIGSLVENDRRNNNGEIDYLNADKLNKMSAATFLD